MVWSPNFNSIYMAIRIEVKPQIYLDIPNEFKLFISMISIRKLIQLGDISEIYI